MDIHEYQAKERFRSVGIPVPPGRVVGTPEEAEIAAEEYGGTVVIKAQVHSGGRGKAGGREVGKTPCRGEGLRVPNSWYGYQWSFG